MTQKFIGHVSVASDQLMLADPKYIVGFLSLHFENLSVCGTGGFALCPPNKTGVKLAVANGSYPVRADFDDHGRMVRAVIDFQPAEIEHAN